MVEISTIGIDIAKNNAPKTKKQNNHKQRQGKPELSLSAMAEAFNRARN